MANLVSLLVLVTVAIAQHAQYDTKTYGEFSGKFRKKEPQRSNKLRRMLNRRIRKCKINTF